MSTTPLSGAIASDPCQDSWELTAAESGDVVTIPNALPAESCSYWKIGDLITLDLNANGEWVASERYTGMAGPAAGFVKLMGAIASDPFQIPWNLAPVPPGATHLMTNPLPDPGPGHPHRWKIGDLITLDCRLARPQDKDFEWLPHPRYLGLAP